MPMSPTARTMQECKKRGWPVSKAEYFNSFTKRRHDLFNFIDVVALDMDTGTIIGIQSTTTSNLTSRIKKTIELESSRQWKKCGGRIVMHGWAKRGPAGKRKLWTLREVEI